MSYGNKTVLINRFQVQEMGTYDVQHRHSFSAAADVGLIGNILDNIQQKPVIMPADLVNGNSALIEPSVGFDRPVNILHGWNQKRYRFYLELIAIDQLDNRTCWTYMGYTEHNDLNSSFGSFDTKAKFFVNGVSSSALVTRQSAAGASQIYSGINNAQVLHDHAYQTRGGVHSPDVSYNMAPEKVFGSMDNLEIQAFLSSDNNATFSDTSTMVTNRGSLIDRKNLILGDYAAGMVNTLLQQKRAIDSSGGDRDQLYSQCASMFSASTDIHDPLRTLLRQLSHESMDMSLAGDYGNAFTISDLQAAVNRGMFQGNPFPAPPQNLSGFNSGFYQAGSVGGHEAQTRHSVIATLISSALPSYMSIFGFGSLRISMTNMATTTRDAVINIESPFVLAGVNGPQAIESLKYKLTSELLPIASLNNQMGYAIRVRAGIGGECWIGVILDGWPGEMEFVFPLFADALFSPLVTSSKSNLNQLTSTIRTVGEGIDGHAMTHTSNFTIPSTTGFQLPTYQNFPTDSSGGFTL